MLLGQNVLLFLSLSLEIYVRNELHVIEFRISLNQLNLINQYINRSRRVLCLVTITTVG